MTKRPYDPKAKLRPPSYTFDVTFRCSMCDASAAGKVAKTFASDPDPQRCYQYERGVVRNEYPEGWEMKLRGVGWDDIYVLVCDGCSDIAMDERDK